MEGAPSRPSVPSDATVTWRRSGDVADLAPPGRWRPVRLLGAGGQGAVWLADDTELGMRIAVKVVARPDSPEAMERVRREVRTARTVRHPALVRLFDFVEQDGCVAVAMEHLEGGTVRGLLEDGPLPVNRVVEIGGRVLGALGALHAAGVVHRDVKPSNILLDAAGDARLGDLGLVRPVDAGDELTRTGALPGTPSYMSPEQIRGEAATPSSDLYSLGVTLYRMLTGELPFSGGSDYAVIEKQLRAPPPAVRTRRRECPRWLAGFVARCLAKRPDDRWPDARTALAAFERRRTGLGPRRRRALGWTALGAAAAGTLALAAVWMQPSASIADVQVTERTAIVRDPNGRELWRRPLAATACAALVGDFHRRRGLEVVTVEPSPVAGGELPDVVVRDGTDIELARSSLPLSVRSYFPDVGPGFDLFLRPVSLDDDPYDDLLWIANDRTAYAGIVGTWNADPETTARVAALNSGHVRACTVADLDADGRRELLVGGLNNLLGFQWFVGRTSLGREHPAVPPELWSVEQSAAGRPFGYDAYLLLGEYRPGDLRLRVDGREVQVVQGGATHDLGPGSLLHEPGAASLRRFWRDVAGLRSLSDPVAVTAAFGRLGESHPQLWSDPAYRGAAALMAAAMLAERGAPLAGADLLRAARTGVDAPRRTWRVEGELRLIAGRFDGGVAALEEAVAMAGRGFPPLDELLGLALAAAVTGNEDLMSRAESHLRVAIDTGADGLLRELSVVRSFLWGEHGGHAPQLDPHPGAFEAAAVLRRWSRLEAGSASDDDTGALGQLPASSGTRDLARLALARHAHLAGRPGKARQIAGDAVWNLEQRARTDWPSAAWWTLGRWVLAEALLDSGEPEAALPHLEAVAAYAPGTFYGRTARERLEQLPAP